MRAILLLKRIASSVSQNLRICESLQLLHPERPRSRVYPESVCGVHVWLPKSSPPHCLTHTLAQPGVSFRHPHLTTTHRTHPKTGAKAPALEFLIDFPPDLDSVRFGIGVWETTTPAVNKPALTNTQTRAIAILSLLFLTTKTNRNKTK